MNIDHMEAFMYVVHLESIHKAAEALYLSQPTVTARIKTLERDLGIELFLRKGRSLTLSEEGKAFIPYAEQIIQTYDQGKKLLKKEDNPKEIVIGANIITSQYFIPFALPFLKKSHPELRFKFISATNDVLLEKLLQKQVDIAFLKEISHHGIQKHELLNNSVRLVVYPDHSFESLKNISIQQLAMEPMVFFECGAFDWNRIHKLFEVANVKPNIEFLVDHLEVAKSIILSKNGIGFLPYLCVKKELELGELIEIDVSHFIHLNQHIYAAYLNNSFGNQQLWNDILFSVKEFEKQSILCD
ncbi:LysR family transcriptional regulator [Paenibacillus sp. BSR1-1]|uniref:LysR family transcriptional regulator n=1 Tax=Paenibacillus sp. BSR1-1 TaxID=3020845 RepID=UPI0025AF8B07|nr:LysR family transcriptional regulator [Paenibacillus sp. BSR1-1]MDN3016889.1 LysR family transcriptional regulator [Paenibacillus sp. BSR1-1]